MAAGGIRWSWDTIPHLLTVALGAAVMFACGVWFGIIYLLIFSAGMVWFLVFICTRCAAYGNHSCPSGYGLISAKFFRKRRGSFRKAFRYNIVSVALQWFVPTGVGLYFLITRFDTLLFVLYLLFIPVAYVYLPLASRKKGCGTCPQRYDCPWKR